jgi:hypothetical protein
MMCFSNNKLGEREEGGGGVAEKTADPAVIFMPYLTFTLAELLSLFITQ